MNAELYHLEPRRPANAGLWGFFAFGANVTFNDMITGGYSPAAHPRRNGTEVRELKADGSLPGANRPEPGGTPE